MASSSESNMISSSASHLCLPAQTCHPIFLSTSKKTHMKQSSWEVMVISMSSSSFSIDSSDLFFTPSWLGETALRFELIVVIWDISSYYCQPSKLLNIPSKCSGSFELSLWRRFSWERNFLDFISFELFVSYFAGSPQVSVVVTLELRVATRIEFFTKWAWRRKTEMILTFTVFLKLFFSAALFKSLSSVSSPSRLEASSKTNVTFSGFKPVPFDWKLWIYNPKESNKSPF